ncbi:hypothetical protein NV377_19415 [Paenibacillus sp. T3-5-0-4]|nr:hypothetical protein [Paenibacillus endoradicis]
MYILSTRVPDFPSSLHIRCRIFDIVNHRYQSSLFELLLAVHNVHH